MNTENFFIKNKLGTNLHCRLDWDNQEQGIVFILGGFESYNFIGASQTIFHDIFRKQGFATLRMEKTGNGKSGGDLSRADISTGLADTAVAMEWIEKQQWVDKNNIALAGSSFGGGLIYQHAMRSDSSLYKMMALVCPLVDMSALAKSIPAHVLKIWRDAGTMEVFGSKLHHSVYDDFLKYDAWSGAQFIKTPTLIVHGTHDDIVPYAWSQRLQQTMPNVQLHPITGAKHRITESQHGIETRRAVENWILSQRKLLK